MPPRRKAKKGVKRTEEDKKEIPREEKKEDFVDEEGIIQIVYISRNRAIRDVEIEHTLTALDLLCSYFTEEQIQTPVLGFFKDNLPDLSIARDEESGEIELKWNDSDGVDVNDSILKRLSMGFPDLYSSRPSLGGYNNVEGSMLGTGNTHLQNLGTSTSQMLASHDALRTPVVNGQRLSFGMTPKTRRQPKPGEIMLSVHGSPLGVYKEDDNMGAINEEDS
ncbi:uncharacterized protein LOC106436701 isoform X1 [Brassica napus]|uniref:uncharacterized protein LOC106436701 isoform X1 n=1 Tax=Brassica napus TaxID=3708 RepID=UPI0006AAAA7A|nr:uncharacterized protein LOC106436701 isoform X1 [Brassica napus]